MYCDIGIICGSIIAPATLSMFAAEQMSEKCIHGNQLFVEQRSPPMQVMGEVSMINNSFAFPTAILG